MLFLHTAAPAAGNWYDWHLHPDVILAMLLLSGAYLYAIGPLRRRAADVGRVSKGRQMSFFLGIFVLYAATSSPMHELSEEYLISAHMLQHVLITMVVAPLLLGGIPGWVWQLLLRGRLKMRLARALTNPLVAFGSFNAVLLLAHLPGTIESQTESEPFHLLIHALLLTSGLLVWWPVLSPLPELPRLPYGGRMAYLFLQSLLPAVLASFVTFSNRAVYSVYEDAPRLWGISAIEDQQIAGGLMKILGTAILWSFIGVAFFKWYEAEQKQELAPRWPEVEQELGQMGLTSGELGSR